MTVFACDRAANPTLVGLGLFIRAVSLERSYEFTLESAFNLYRKVSFEVFMEGEES